MNPNQAFQQEEQEDDLSYVHRQALGYGGGSQNQWQVDPRDIRIHVEESLRGQRTRIVKRRLYQILTVEKLELYSAFFATNDEKAEKEFNKIMMRDNNDPRYFTITRTQQEEETETTEPISDPLVNDVGAYHILSIIETVFSRVGYMSNLDSNEINDIMFTDILVPLATTMMKNHVAYGIDKGSRDEIVSLILTTSFMILKSSEKGWTGDRFAGVVKETIVNTTPQPAKQKRWGII